MNKGLALVTGASAGIGAETALRLAAAGFTTSAAARRVDKMEELKAHGIKVLPLDITDAGRLQRAGRRQDQRLPALAVKRPPA